MPAASTSGRPLHERVAVFFDELFRLDPLRATATGDHRFDAEWPDMSEDGRRARLAFIDRWEAEFAAVAPEGLSADDRAEREVLLAELAAMRFADTDLREDRWDPLSWVYILGMGIFPILAREFAPLHARLASVAGRLEGIPRLLAAAQEQLQGHDGRPVSKFHTETALKQLSGIADLADEAVNAGVEAESADADVRFVLPRLRVAAATAKGALDQFEVHLREVVLPGAEGEGRLGRALFQTKMRHTLKSDLSPAEILERANREYVAVRREMIRLAREAWPRFLGDRPRPTAASAGIQEAADSETVRVQLADLLRAQGRRFGWRPAIHRMEPATRSRNRCRTSSDSSRSEANNSHRSSWSASRLRKRVVGSNSRCWCRVRARVPQEAGRRLSWWDHRLRWRWYCWCYRKTPRRPGFLSVSRLWPTRPHPPGACLSRDRKRMAWRKRLRYRKGTAQLRRSREKILSLRR